MKASRTAMQRQLDFQAIENGAASLQNAIVRYVCGSGCKPKVKSVSEYQVLKYFRATDRDFTRTQLKAAVSSGRISSINMGRFFGIPK